MCAALCQSGAHEGPWVGSALGPVVVDAASPPNQCSGDICGGDLGAVHSNQRDAT